MTDEKKPEAPRKKSRAEIRRENEMKFARECRKETPFKTRSGVKIPKRGSGNCADHKTNGREV